MSQKMIDIVLTHHWFDQILKGRKTAEYRRLTPFWAKRIGSLVKGDYVVFRRGYTGQTLARQVEHVKVIRGWDLPNEEYNYFGCPNEEQFFEIKFG